MAAAVAREGQLPQARVSQERCSVVLIADVVPYCPSLAE
jgi:hypothetical protein